MSLNTFLNFTMALSRPDKSCPDIDFRQVYFLSKMDVFLKQPQGFAIHDADLTL